MASTASSSERRRRRSPHRYPATSHYLESLLAREGLTAAVLSDADGPIAGKSTIGADLDDVANLGTLGIQGALGRELGDEVWAQSLRIGGDSLTLTTLGGRVKKTDVESDLARIFRRVA
jgi:hypothetical protein